MLKTAFTLVCLTFVSFLGTSSETAFAQDSAKMQIDSLSIGRVVDRGRIPMSLDEMMSKTVGRVSEKAVNGYKGNFQAYWEAAQTSRVGKALEAVACDTVNSRNGALGSKSRWVTTASLGHPSHPADIVELDARGKVTRKIQAGTGHKNVLSKLVDPKYKGMDILTDSDTLSSLQKELTKKSALAKQSGRSLTLKHKALQDALNSGRLIKKLPQGTPLPTKQFITKQAQVHASRCFKQTMQIVHKVTPKKLDKVLSTGKGIAQSGGKAAAKAAAKAVPVVVVAWEVADRVGRATDVEDDFRSGKITQKQREREHVKNASGTVGGFGGALAGAQFGAFAGTVGGPWGAAAGGIAGGVAGYYGGEAAATAAADWSMKTAHQTGNTIAGAASSAANWTGRKASQTGKAISGAASSATNWTAKTASQTGNAIGGAASSAANWTGRKASQTGKAIGGVASSARNSAVNAWDYIWGN